jgi:hypothetical protein
MTVDANDSKDTFEMFGIELSVCESCEEVMVGDMEICNACVGQVPVRDLRDKISEWKWKSGLGDWENNATLEWCAEDLEELVEQYE